MIRITEIPGINHINIISTMNDLFVFDSKLDAAFLYSIYEDDMEHIEIVFEKFVKSIGEQVAELEQSYQGGDPEYFRKNIHKMKPVLSYVGLTGLTDKAEQIENNCYDINHTHAISELYLGFMNELNDMIPVVVNDWNKLKT